MVDAYSRVVNGKVVKVNAYGKDKSTTTTALQNAWKKPGRPQMQATPGTYASGRDIPGQKPKSLGPVSRMPVLDPTMDPRLQKKEEPGDEFR